MRREEKAFIVLGVAGVALLVLNSIFGQYDWWPAVFKKVETHTSGTTIGLTLAIASYLAFTTMAQMRYHSPVAMSENRRWSWNPILDQPIPAGEWYVIMVGGIEAGGFSAHGHDAIVVIHRDGFQQVGVHGRFHAPLRRWLISELPEDARRVIRRDGLHKGGIPIYFGLAPSFIEARVRDYSKETREIARKNIEHDLLQLSTVRTQRTLDQNNKMLAITVQDKAHGPIVSAWRRFKAKGEEDDDHNRE